MTTIPAPMSLLAELTHRCPLSCPYCSNPLQLEHKTQELSTDEWKKILLEASKMGILQIHFSGGEPMSRPDLNDLIHYAHTLNLYTNLITSGVFISEKSINALDHSGIDHIQLSFQDTDITEADKLSGFKNVQSKKIHAAQLIAETDIPLTLNFVLQRSNIERIPQMFALARKLKAHRIEMAHTQYYGWALKNRSLLLPSEEQIHTAEELIAKEKETGGILIDYVTPDYYSTRPKPCMGGWGQRFINISPSGKVLPCHAAETIPNLHFNTVKEASLTDIWYHSEAFNRFRGTAWMPEPCSSCTHKERDWGGCRCQALALTGAAENTDPVCSLSSSRRIIDEALIHTSQHSSFIYRR